MAGQAGDELFVAAIEVDIERREMRRAITPRLPQVYFEKKGETGEIELVGDFGNVAQDPKCRVYCFKDHCHCPVENCD
jgi:hypothetical protein